MAPGVAAPAGPRPARSPRAAQGPGRSTDWLRVAALAVAALAAVVAGIAFTGAAAPTALRDPGALVRWGLPIASTGAELAASATLGGLVLLATVLVRRDETVVRAASGITAVAAGVWTLTAVVELVLTYANVAGLSPTDPAFGGELGQFVTQFELGRVLLFVAVAAAVTTALALMTTSPVGTAWIAGLVLVALWQSAQTGHAAGAASHDLATSSMFLHLVGAALWIGTLLALSPLAHRLGADLAPAVARFSVIAAWCFAAVAVSGTVNSVIRLGSWDDLTTRYGVLLLVKIALFGVLGLLGLAHRRRVVGRLRGDERAPATWLFWRLVLVELTVMGAVSGVAVALGSSPPPVPDDPITDPTPAEIVTGHALPPEPTTLSWITQWRWDVLLASAAVAGIVVYLRWAIRLRRRGDTWSWGRTASWVTGMLLFFWTTSGGPAMYGHVLFSAHMVEHMILAMVIPVLLALSAPVTLALRALPARASRAGAGRGTVDASRGPREWLLGLVHSRWGRFLANPVVAAVNFAGSMIVFYYTDVFRWALTSEVGHYAMVVHFSLAGYLFVNALVGIDPGPNRPPYPQRLLLLFATMAFHAFFGVALTTGDVLLVPDWFGLLGREWGPSAIVDQQRGGGVAWGIGELPTLALAVAVAFAWARDDERTAKRRDRKVERDGDTEMDEYNAMLARLAQRDARGTGDAGGAPREP
ncbi:bifunctional copper resistance protein CopD/cytochrome c oxidase assembly protein [Cellulomonas sp. ACRRI]|uniref:cytochrome c oxidase assembly protein n=1 Tax=Cellulomonas sp. ACRRI TaxID=2918188 RepID=UPI001EF3B981|nr:cytochrome c oxidase assembly protein [Cellulomonas sp. ACRRI]MCG7287631.1 bifunctional copper resistance protein CopD/cytochrome c oxidase assembly protein [Cellulomonas sp. ACRRI]